MDTFSLKDKQADIQLKFSGLQDQKQALIEQIKKIDEESLKLSGQYTILDELLKEADEPTKDKKDEKGKK